MGDKVDLRFYNVPNKSFHPKAYIFEYVDKGEIFVGSSNISRSALMNGIEWNYRICNNTSPEDYTYFKQSFEDLFLNKSIIVDDNEMRKYSKNWKRPKLFEDLEKLEDGNPESEKSQYISLEEAQHEIVIDSEDSDECKIIEYPRPIGPQIEALYELKKSRLEGWDKGIVVAATGVGKTFLAAFDSEGFERVLFIAHREEILIQAEGTFKCVRPDSSRGFFSGDRKDRNCDILFATVQTLGRKEYLKAEYFLRDKFDYIVIDEFHHAVVDSYKNIIEYFRIKEDLRERPLRLSMYTYLDETIYNAIRSKKELNIFEDFILFLNKIDEAEDDEKALIGTVAHEFLKEMESTKMSKLYKMPLLLAFYNNGNIRLEINEDDTYESFKEFYSNGSNSIDLLRDKNTRNYKDWGKREYVNLASRNPMHFFMHSSSKFFYEADNKFYLSPVLEKFISNPAFVRHFKDIIDYKTRRFYKERLESRLADIEKMIGVESENS